jgi:Fur family ferric uptake transcriptional regulator
MTTDQNATDGPGPGGQGHAHHGAHHQDPSKTAGAASALRDELRQRGLRLTPQRQLVLQAVSDLGHSRPEEICAQVQRTAPGVNASTVYRTLDVLEQIGLVRHSHLGHGAPTYHAAEDADHIHLVCQNCDDVLSVPLSVADALVGTLLRDYAFEPDMAHFAIHGRCGHCSDDGSAVGPAPTTDAAAAGGGEPSP